MSVTTAGRGERCHAASLFSYVVFRLRGKLLVFPLIAVLFIRYHETESNLIAYGLGGAIFALGLALRVWAQMHLHFRLRKSMQLTLTGPYAYLRNPVYVGNVFMACGLCIGGELPWMVPVALLWCVLLYAVVVRYEEVSLLERYGEAYAEYLERVPRWLPKLRRAQPAGEGSVLRFLAPSLRIECLTLLYWAPIILKEVLPHWWA